MRGMFFSSSKPSSPSHSTVSSPSRMTPPRRPRTVSSTIMEEKMVLAEEIIAKWDLNSSTYTRISYLFGGGDRRVSREFLTSVNFLQSVMHFLVSDQLDSSAASEKLVHAQKLMEVAMKRLEKEFYQILSSNREFLDPESISTRSSRSRWSADLYHCGVDDSSEEELDYENRLSSSSEEGDRVSDSVMADLKAIADCMISSGYGKECVKIYKIVRKSIVDETLYKLGIDQKLNFNQVNKMEWEALELKIKKWLYAVKVAVKTLFNGERILCDNVFSTSDKIRESVFSEVCRERAVTLFEFPEIIARSKKSPERLFRTLDLYNAITEYWQEIQVIFAFESTSAVLSQAMESLVKLGDAARTMLSDFEAAIQKEAPKVPVAGGGVHPLTRYVMNYLVLLGDYSGALADILADWKLPVQTPLPESYLSSPAPDGSSPISEHLAWLLLVLLCKIDGKAELYKDVALSYLFLANNLNYVVSKVRNSSLKLLVGADWLVKLEAKVKQHAGKYERMAWSKVLSCLPGNPETISVDAARECFRQFNHHFEEAYRKQSGWVIPDPKFRDEIKISVAKKISPAYWALYGKFRGVLRGTDSVVRYAPDDLGNYLSDLFHGSTTGSSTGSTTKSSNSHSHSHSHSSNSSPSGSRSR